MVKHVCLHGWIQENHRHVTDNQSEKRIGETEKYHKNKKGELKGEVVMSVSESRFNPHVSDVLRKGKCVSVLERLTKIKSHQKPVDNKLLFIFSFLRH